MATHDIEFAAKYVDQCMMLFDGKVIMNDAPKEFFSGNFFYTTSINRFIRKELPLCINVGGCVRSVSKRYVAFIIFIFAVVICTLLFTTLIMDGYYMLSSLFLLAIIMLPFYIRFERKAFVSREIVIVAVLAAIAAVSRVPFSILPSVQPTSFCHYRFCNCFWE